VHASREGGADVADGRLAGLGIQRGQLDRDIGAGRLEKFVY
jgi:hypothetical protein